MSVSAIKQYCLDSDLVSLYAKVLKSVRVHNYNVEHGTDFQCPFSYNDALDIIDSYFSDNDIRRECKNLTNAYFERVKRLEKRISMMLALGNCVFLTLTFTDKCLSDTNLNTRRQYVRRWLDSVSPIYIANIDFGKTNHREHYHAVVLLENTIDYTSFGHGAVNGKVVRSENDYKKLSKYVAKLKNHAIKETTNNHKIIYSRLNDFRRFLVNTSV